MSSAERRIVPDRGMDEILASIRKIISEEPALAEAASDAPAQDASWSRESGDTESVRDLADALRFAHGATDRFARDSEDDVLDLDPQSRLGGASGIDSAGAATRGDPRLYDQRLGGARVPAAPKSPPPVSREPDPMDEEAFFDDRDEGSVLEPDEGDFSDDLAARDRALGGAPRDTAHTGARPDDSILDRASPGRQTGMPRLSDQDLEALVASLVQPMIRAWLDENLPQIVEAAVADEIAHWRAVATNR